MNELPGTKVLEPSAAAVVGVPPPPPIGVVGKLLLASTASTVILTRYNTSPSCGMCSQTCGTLEHNNTIVSNFVSQI